MSAFSLDEALKNVDDETAVNQLVGSLEKSLERQSVSVQHSNGVLKSSDDLTHAAIDSQSYGALKNWEQKFFRKLKKEKESKFVAKREEQNKKS